MKWVALLALLAGCPTAASGTIDLGLTTAPGSTLLDGVTVLRVELTNPRQIVEAPRGPDGFSVSLDVEANGEPGTLVVEGFDANGGLIAVGQSPEFGVAAINARIVIYMGAPLSVARAPASLSPARANVQGDVLLPFGVIFAGGRDAANAPSDALAIYNAYDHTLVGGKPMPAPRDGIVVATGANGIVSLYGGRDAAMNPTGTFWLFDSNFAPSGAYLEVRDNPGFVRANQTALEIGIDKFVITGEPAIDLDLTTTAPRTDVAGLAPSGASFVTPAGLRTALALDTTGRLVRFSNNTFEVLAFTRPGGAIASMPDGRFIVVGGGTAEESNDVLVVDTAGNVSMISDVLAAPRTDAHVAATRRHVVITGDPIEILDASTLAPIATRAAIEGLPFSLPNEQVLIVDSTNGELSLFTPPRPGV
ncbi:MAG: hypothetical protein M4D80_12540 [Myxococcota bacterium]|nr:hypothetical protein [Myxococcota bacterium]